MNLQVMGQRIAGRRKTLGLTREALSRQAGVGEAALSAWEEGRACPEPASLIRLSTALQLSVAALLPDTLTQPARVEGRLDRIRAAAPLTVAPDGRTGQAVSPFLFGENLEHTRADVFMGLSAQMLRNRKFAGKPLTGIGCSMEWYPIGEQVFFAHCEAYTRHHPELYHMRRAHERNAQRIVNLEGGQAGIGQHELPVAAHAAYEFRLVARAPEAIELQVSLTGRHGGAVYAQASLTVCSRDWTAYSLTLTSEAADPDADLRLTFETRGTLEIGAVSLMPAGHFRGMRRDVIARLREMGVRLLRWPGGNFAGEYCWADGLLPVDMRAPLRSYQDIETQPRSLGFDYHEIDTDDFIALCREIGAEPFITINPAWNTPGENAAWVEYCNGSPDTKYGAMRAARGHEAPYNVQFWSLGNEFGYGHMEGENTPAGYAAAARAQAKAMLEVCGTLSLCSSGPYPNPDWAQQAASALQDVAPLVSLHYYAPSPTYADPARLQEEYCQCLHSVETAREQIHALRGQLGNAGGISFDEWNTWYAWYRPGSTVDGLFTALMLHMFIQEAAQSGVSLVCHFEAVNEGMIEVRPEGAELTASGQAFSLMQLHACGTLLCAQEDAAISRREDVLTVTAVNPAWDRPREVSVQLDGKLIKASLYTCAQAGPFQRFTEEPVNPVRTENAWQITMPPHSLLLLQASPAGPAAMR